MIQEKNAKLANRYAQAFLNIQGQQMTPAILDRLARLYQFLVSNSSIMFFFSIPTLDLDAKEKGLTFLSEKFQLSDAIGAFILFLLQSKRIVLLPLVLRSIDELYKKEHAVSSFVISSSHPLTEKDLVMLQQFLVRHTGRTIIYKYKEDKDLIAGIRMWSDHYLWEHSVAQQLRSIQSLLIR